MLLSVLLLWYPWNVGRLHQHTMHLEISASA